MSYGASRLDFANLKLARSREQFADVLARRAARDEALARADAAANGHSWPQAGVPPIAGTPPKAASGRF
jgi:hypothetical protein